MQTQCMHTCRADAALRVTVGIRIYIYKRLRDRECEREGLKTTQIGDIGAKNKKKPFKCSEGAWRSELEKEPGGGARCKIERGGKRLRKSDRQAEYRKLDRNRKYSTYLVPGPGGTRGCAGGWAKV